MSGKAETSVDIARQSTPAERPNLHSHPTFLKRSDIPMYVLICRDMMPKMKRGARWQALGQDVDGVGTDVGQHRFRAIRVHCSHH